MQEGIKESKELILGIMKLAEVLGPIMKDGFQAGQDLPALAAVIAGNAQFQAALKQAMEGADKIPAELGDFSLAEGVELLIPVAMELPKVVAAWKK